MGLLNREPNVEKLKAKRNVKGLVKALKYHGVNQYYVWEEAAKALGEIGDKTVVESILRIWSDERRKEQKERVRINQKYKDELINALGKIGGEKVIEPLIQVLADGLPSEQKEAAKALGNIGNFRAVDPLIQALKDEYLEVREAAVEALGKIPDVRAIEGLIEVQRSTTRVPFMWSSIRWEAGRALKKIGKPAIEPLIRALEDEDQYVREGAAWVLGEIGDEKTVESLIPALSDEKWEVRNKAAEALRKIPNERAVEPLGQALSDEKWEVREKVIEALCNIGRPAVKLLIRALKNKDSYVSKKATEALGEIGDLKTAEEVINTIFDRAYNIVSTWDREGNVRKIQNEWKNKFRNLFADYTDLIIDAALFNVIKIKEHYGGYYYEYSLDNTEDATKKLCMLYTPISNNILHIIAKRRDIEVALSERLDEETGCSLGFSQKTLSFDLLREVAKKELERRGNLPHDSSVYLNEKAWKL
ncbi:MAG: HEAT repeat domain-containing protein [Candidatus Methanofastidiosia archaeon]